jgi:hypothetical protein
VINRSIKCIDGMPVISHTSQKNLEERFELFKFFCLNKFYYRNYLYCIYIWTYIIIEIVLLLIFSTNSHEIANIVARATNKNQPISPHPLYPPHNCANDFRGTKKSLLTRGGQRHESRVVVGVIIHY